MEVAKRVKRWWTASVDGKINFVVRYGSKPLEFAKGKNAIELGSEAIAKKLIKYLESLSKENNWDEIRWITHSSNETAKKLYDRIAKNTGFELYELKRD